MENIFEFICKLENNTFECGCNREQVLLMEMINEKVGNLINGANYGVETSRIITFINYCITDKLTEFIRENDYDKTYHFIIYAFNMFYMYGNENTTKEEFVNILKGNDLKAKFYNY